MHYSSKEEDEDDNNFDGNNNNNVMRICSSSCDDVCNHDGDNNISKQGILSGGLETTNRIALRASYNEDSGLYQVVYSDGDIRYYPNEELLRIIETEDVSIYIYNLLTIYILF